MIEKPTNVVYINIFIAVQIKNESTDFMNHSNWETKKIIVPEIHKRNTIVFQKFRRTKDRVVNCECLKKKITIPLISWRTSERG